jgi:hypothetical protein
MKALKTVTLPNGRTVQLEPELYRKIQGVAQRSGWDMGKLVMQALHRWADQGGEVHWRYCCAMKQIAEESHRHGLTPKAYLRVIDFGPQQ